MEGNGWRGEGLAKLYICCHVQMVGTFGELGEERDRKAIRRRMLSTLAIAFLL